MTTKLLGSAGLPVPKQETVRSAEGAVAAARRIGFPVVVKPLDGNHGRGVCLNLQTTPTCARRSSVAEDQSRRGYVIVESMVTGRDYRCLIVGGRMQAIAERVPAHVTGDGTHTVGELVEHHQLRPAPRGRPREGAHQDQGRRRRAGAARRAGLRARRRAARRHDGQAGPDRQHVDRRHLDRPHLRRAPRQRRDRRGGGPADRARRGRHRLHLPRHRLAGARDRRRDLRGQRRPRVPDAHPPDRRRAAVHRQAGRRPALPARARPRGCRSWP